jgi:CrcB protein
MDLYKILTVALGGALGSVARYLTVRSVDARLNAVLPYGTLVVNVVGSFAIGLLYGLAMRKTGFSEPWRLFLGAGFCGGFTTFSAFAWENFSLWEQKMAPTALVYVAVTLVLGIFSVFAGSFASRFIE